MHGHGNANTTNLARMRNNGLAVLLQVLGTMGAWIGLFELNIWFFGYFEWTQVISWIFLPAAVRLLCVMLFNWRGALGLWLGTLVTNVPVFGNDLFLSLMVATISAMGPLIAIYFTMRYLKISMDLRELTTGKLTVFAFVAALCNVIPHNIFFWIAGVAPSPFTGLIPMFVGDIAGTVLVFYMLRGVLFAIERFARFSTH